MWQEVYIWNRQSKGNRNWQSKMLNTNKKEKN